MGMISQSSLQYKADLLILYILKKEGKLNAKFKESLGEVAYHAPCHQRVQNIGPKTKEILELIPDTNITLIERCSGHNGTYAVKREYHEISMKICKPIIDEIDGSNLDHYISDCPMAGHQIDNGVQNIEVRSESPFTLLRKAYGI